MHLTRSVSESVHDCVICILHEVYVHLVGRVYAPYSHEGVCFFVSVYAHVASIHASRTKYICISQKVYMHLSEGVYIRLIGSVYASSRRCICISHLRRCMYIRLIGSIYVLHSRCIYLS